MGGQTEVSRGLACSRKLKYHGLACSRKLRAGDWFGLLAAKPQNSPTYYFGWQSVGVRFEKEVARNCPGSSVKQNRWQSFVTSDARQTDVEIWDAFNCKKTV